MVTTLWKRSAAEGSGAHRGRKRKADSEAESQDKRRTPPSHAAAMERTRCALEVLQSSIQEAKHKRNSSKNFLDEGSSARLSRSTLMSTGVSSATLSRSQRRTKSSLLQWTIESVKKPGCHRAGGTVHQKTTFALAIENSFSRGP